MPPSFSPGHPYAFSRSHRYGAAIDEMIGYQAPAFAEACLDVHKDDDMFGFSVGVCGRFSLAAMAYFRAGLSIYDSIDQVARWGFDGLEHVDRFLDFACGYGRSNRFLAPALSPSRLWVSDIQRDAVEFQQARFGVHGFESARAPEDLRCEEHFDMIFVASLFSHLPPHSFTRWLRRLHDLLAPGGLLVFSVHDEAVNRHGVEMPEEGIVFLPTTEVPALDTADYGATYVTESFVRRALADATGSSDAVRLPRALCFEQDLYVVGKGDGSARGDLSGSYRRGANGALDLVEIYPDELRLTGWAADVDRVGIDHIEILLGGEVVGHGVPRTSRPDVAVHLGDPAETSFLASGWSITCAVPHLRARMDDLLLVGATSAAGSRFTLDVAPLRELGVRGRDLPPPRTGVAAAPRKLATAGRMVRDAGIAATWRHATRRLPRPRRS